MGLSEFEYAFYTAVASNNSAKELMSKDKLRELAVALTNQVTDVTHSISRQRATIKDCPYKPSCRGNPRSRKISM
jgi:hypothetical protein